MHSGCRKEAISNISLSNSGGSVEFVTEDMEVGVRMGRGGALWLCKDSACFGGAKDCRSGAGPMPICRGIGTFESVQLADASLDLTSSQS
jgi:hypothetical protein